MNSLKKQQHTTRSIRIQVKNNYHKEQRGTEAEEAILNTTNRTRKYILIGILIIIYIVMLFIFSGTRLLSKLNIISYIRM